MENVTINDLYTEIKKVSQKIDSLELMLIPEVEISKEEETELKDMIEDSKKGNTTPWRKLKGKQ